MRSNVVYRMNNPSVIGEVLDGEAIIVNLDSGAYYSLTGVGASVWTAALAEATVEQISARVSAEYTGAAAEIAEGVTALIEELIAEGLLVADNVHGAPGLQPAPPIAAAPDIARRPFVKLVLQKYTDMADLLLLDPIHEVDEQGWPQPAPRK